MAEQELPDKQQVTDTDVLDRAVQVLGSTSAAMRWMVTPIAELDDTAPRSLLHTRSGKRAVIAVLERLERSRT